MSRIILLFSLLVFLPFAVAAQELPKGYVGKEGLEGKLELKADFDRDGKGDLLTVVEAKGQTLVYVAMGDGRTLKSKDAPRCCHSIALVRDVIVLRSEGMRGFYTWRFRYVAAAKDFRLIGMDTESFGNAAGDYSGTSSLNLLNGDFIAKYYRWSERLQKKTALPVVKKKLKVSRRIMLNEFGDESDDWVFSLTYKHLPKGAQ